ncbi:MAG TPA: hypothetical protein VFN74_06760 [Chloroflexota bacterium]|nr:hypothetical protein [Chloroflexota bacterium]
MAANEMPAGRPERPENEVEAQRVEADEDALLTVLGYVRALLAFEHAPSAQRWERSQEVLRASAAMDRVFGCRTEARSVWPVPIGPSTALLEEIELRVVAALARRGVSTAAPMDAVEAAIMISRRPVEGERNVPPQPATSPPRAASAPGTPGVSGVSGVSGASITGRSWGDLLGTYRRAFAADPPFKMGQAPRAIEAPAAEPEPLDARLRFVRWMVERGRISDAG